MGGRGRRRRGFARCFGWRLKHNQLGAARRRRCHRRWGWWLNLGCGPGCGLSRIRRARRAPGREPEHRGDCEHERRSDEERCKAPPACRREESLGSTTEPICERPVPETGMVSIDSARARAANRSGLPARRARPARRWTTTSARSRRRGRHGRRGAGGRSCRPTCRPPGPRPARRHPPAPPPSRALSRSAGRDRERALHHQSVQFSGMSGFLVLGRAMSPFSTLPTISPGSAP